MPYDRHTLRNMDRAYGEAKKGALDGALRWGAGGVVVFSVAQFTWPLYRNLTVPFKTFLLMSCVITGGMVHADRRMQETEKLVRHEQLLARREAIEREVDAAYSRQGVDRR